MFPSLKNLFLDQYYTPVKTHENKELFAELKKTNENFIVLLLLLRVEKISYSSFGDNSGSIISKVGKRVREQLQSILSENSNWHHALKTKKAKIFMTKSPFNLPKSWRFLDVSFLNYTLTRKGPSLDDL